MEWHFAEIFVEEPSTAKRFHNRIEAGEPIGHSAKPRSARELRQANGSIAALLSPTCRAANLGAAGLA